MTIEEFLEQVCNVTIDYELREALWENSLAVEDSITIKTKSGIVLIGEELQLWNTQDIKMKASL